MSYYISKIIFYYEYFIFQTIHESIFFKVDPINLRGSLVFFVYNDYIIKYC